MNARALLVLSLPVVLAACTPSVTLSVLGGGVSALVSHNLNGSVSRTFTSPLATVRQASQSALESMGVVIESDEMRDGGESLHARAGDRDIELEYESLGETLTVLRATARRPGFLRDNATADEIVRQTESALAVLVADATLAARRETVEASARRAHPPAAVYVVQLESVPKGALRRPRVVPAQLQEHVLYTTEAKENGRPAVQVNLGYFSGEDEAASVRHAALRWYPQARVLRLDRKAAEGGPQQDARLGGYRLAAF